MKDINSLTPSQCELAGALVGLARSLDGSNSSFDMLTVIAASLDALEGEDETEIREMTVALHNAKNKAVPDCSVCKNPCGRTADYDLSELGKLPVKIQSLKLTLIRACADYAKRAVYSSEDYQNVLTDICTALFAVGYEYYSSEELNKLIHDLNGK